MPPSKRRSRGFGGSLLTKPQELPDEEDETAQREQTGPSYETSVAAAQSLLDDVETPSPAMPTQSEPPKEEQDTGPPASVVEEKRASSTKKAPGTLRLNEIAGPQLWDAFLEAKDADPFLSYRKFASDVVLDGLAVRRRRQKRS